MGLFSNVSRASRVFPRSPSWRQQIEASGARQSFLNASLEDGFPYPQLRDFTDDYLRRERLVPQTESSDQRLTSLVNEQTLPVHAAREIAILACVHVLTIPTARRLLLSVRPNNFDTLCLITYLRCLNFTHESNQTAVRRAEADCAKYLIYLGSNPRDPLHTILHLLSSIENGVGSDLLPVHMIHGILRASQIETCIGSCIDELLAERKFYSIYRFVRSLEPYSRGPRASTVSLILDNHFPSWRSWMTWRPNEGRIYEWERREFSYIQQQQLASVFDLERPVSTPPRQHLRAIKDVDLTSSGRIRVAHTDLHLVHDLLNALDGALALGPGSIDLLIWLCLDQTLSSEPLGVVQACIATRDDTCSKRILNLLRNTEPGSTANNRMMAITKAIPIFAQPGTLRDYFVSRVVHSIGTTMIEAQAEFCRELETGAGENIGRRIHAFGTALHVAEWLHEELSPALLSQLGGLPKETTLRQIFSLQSRSTPVPQRNLLKEYLRAALGGNQPMELGVRQVVEELLRFWDRNPDVDRVELANAIAQVPNIDHSLLNECSHRLFKEHDTVIRDMRPIIRSNVARACIGFAKYLAWQHDIHGRVEQCWTSLLLTLIRERFSIPLECGSETLRVDSWLKFVGDLRKVISPDDHRLAQLEFPVERYRWWIELSENYAESLRFFEMTYPSQGSLSWISLQVVPGIRTLLIVAQQHGNATPAEKQLLGFLKPGGSNIAELCHCLDSFGRANPIGRRACESILSRREQWTRNGDVERTLGTLIHLWSRLLRTEVDRVALESVTTLLQIEPHHNAGFQEVVEALVDDCEHIISQARDLEAIRLSLRRHDATQTTALLERLGISDTVGVPDTLVDVAEHVDSNVYELSFPLTHLRKLERQARGIDMSSRMLLVRVSLNGTRPGFCVHFFPGSDGQAAHTYWDVQKGCPRSSICTTKPNRLTYQINQAVWVLLSNDTSGPLELIYNAVSEVINFPGRKCLVCGSFMGIGLWRAQACRRACSRTLKSAPLEIQVPDLVSDPLVVDLLLTSIYMAVQQRPNLITKLLPDCPLPVQTIRTVINSFPPLRSFAAARSISVGLEGSDNYSGDRKKLLSWLFRTFRGYLVSIPRSPTDNRVTRVPAMPQTVQYLLLNSNREREQEFMAAVGDGTGGVVFHGTEPSRLFSVLVDGLRCQSGTPLMLNGAYGGDGIYASDNPTTAVRYSGTTGTSWANSELNDMRVLLGCELAQHTAQDVHLVPKTEDRRILVRYILLCPTNSIIPPARHVEPAMSTTYAFLRTAST